MTAMAFNTCELGRQDREELPGPFHGGWDVSGRLMPQGCRAFPLQHKATLEVPMSLQWKKLNNERLNAR